MYAKQVMHKRNCSPPNERHPPCPWAAIAAPGPAPAGHILGTMSYGLEYPSGQLGSGVPTASPPTFCASGRPGKREKLKSPGLPSND